jgi:hypothetical protein
MAKAKKPELTEEEIQEQQQKAAADKKKKKAAGNFDYYKVDFKLIRDQLGSCCEGSIWEEHVIQKAKKSIKQANRLGDKVTKAYEKFQGTESLTPEKTVKEIKGIIRTFQGLIGKSSTTNGLPDDVEKLLEMAKDVEAEFHELVAKGEDTRATIFMTDEGGDTMISTHMILGNLKEHITTMISTGDFSILKFKNQIGQVFAGDVQPIEEFMTPSQNIAKDEKGVRKLCVRPISFDSKTVTGKKETAIAISEFLPAGTTFGCTLRVRKLSPIDFDALDFLFDHGKNKGFGPWRGSGNKGAYQYKLKKLKGYREPVDPDGWK